jgi:beta-xylosidase
VRWLRDLGVRHLRTGLSWADCYRPGWENWFDKQMLALEEFDVTVTFCFTPEHRGLEPHHTSPPIEVAEFAEFCSRMVRRYAPGQTLSEPPRVPASPDPASVAPQEWVSKLDGIEGAPRVSGNGAMEVSQSRIS